MKRAMPIQWGVKEYRAAKLKLELNLPILKITEPGVMDKLR